MRTIRMTVTGDQVDLDSSVAGVQGSGNVDTLVVELDETWDGFAKTATWWNALGQDPVKRILTADLLEDLCEVSRRYLLPIPPEPLALAGTCQLVIDGYQAGKRARSVCVELEVLAAPVDDDAGDPADPTPTQAEQLQGEIDSLLGNIGQLAQSAEQAKNDAQHSADSAAESARLSENAAQNVIEAEAGSRSALVSAARDAYQAKLMLDGEQIEAGYILTVEVPAGETVTVTDYEHTVYEGAEYEIEVPRDECEYDCIFAGGRFYDDSTYTPDLGGVTVSFDALRRRWIVTNANRGAERVRVRQESALYSGTSIAACAQQAQTARDDAVAARDDAVAARDDAVTAKDEAEAAQAGAVEAARHYPIVDEQGYWRLWDPAIRPNGGYQPTAVKARGENGAAGAPGPAPFVDEYGRWNVGVRYGVGRHVQHEPAKSKWSLFIKALNDYACIYHDPGYDGEQNGFSDGTVTADMINDELYLRKPDGSRFSSTDVYDGTWQEVLVQAMLSFRADYPREMDHWLGDSETIHTEPSWYEIQYAICNYGDIVANNRFPGDDECRAWCEENAPWGNGPCGIVQTGFRPDCSPVIHNGTWWVWDPNGWQNEGEPERWPDFLEAFTRIAYGDGDETDMWALIDPDGDGVPEGLDKVLCLYEAGDAGTNGPTPFRCSTFDFIWNYAMTVYAMLIGAINGEDFFYQGDGWAGWEDYEAEDPSRVSMTWKEFQFCLLHMDDPFYDGEDPRYPYGFPHEVDIWEGYPWGPGMPGCYKDTGVPATYTLTAADKQEIAAVVAAMQSGEG